VIKKLLQERLPLVAAMISMVGDAVKGFLAEDKKRLARKPEPKPGTPAARRAKRAKAARTTASDARRNRNRR